MRLRVLIAAVFLTFAYPVFAPANDQGTAQKQEQTQDEELKKKFFYQWTDSKGVVHLTDSLEKVPGRYRSGARKTEAGPGVESVPGEMGSDATFDNSEGEERQADLREQWQQRMITAKQKLADLELRQHELEQTRTDLLGKWGGPASGHILDKDELDRIEKEMQQVQQAIGNARNQIEVVIPEEARKAGIPPGWLRE